MLKALFCGSVAALIFCGTALATTPTLSGIYTLTDIQTCSSDQSSVSFDSGAVTFAKRGKLNYSLNHTGGSFPGNNNLFTLTQPAGTTSYSNTGTTLTISGNVYQVTYGTVNSSGVATYVSYTGVTEGGECENAGWFMLK